jgi:hypothetical protein
MILPDPDLFSTPLHVWLGFATLTLVLIQILIGKRIIKVPFRVHTKIVWKILIAVALVHAFYGFEIYFLS